MAGKRHRERHRIVEILGRRWRLEFSNPGPKADGDCSDPGDTDKRIRVRSSLRGITKLETIIHEVLHAADWHKSEEWVEQVAGDLAKILHKLGYREISNEPD
jgi:hypothetical protein